ncbi:DUF4011 domain-containing protein [Actinophytocola oryzae]|uniref:AAA domain-containing protein n=1 Tax=Actinophytocola oryzae TaxID=502181 RepID=A0A4R7VRM9_9PSEU|nr:DUF4011 domain-containing protein [Actinophytocola oryzae]TDV52019.1 AAA domain-containing protein [Actinophytocola oryzae]
MTTSTFRLAELDDERLGIELLHPPAMFYALVHNNVPVVHHLRVRNDGGTNLRDVEVRMELVGPDGTLAGPWTRRVPVIPAFGEVGWDEFGDFSPATAALVHVDEAFPVTYEVTVTASGVEPARLVAPSRVLAHNEWQNSPALYDSIAAFVQPNTDSVNVVLRAASTLLRARTGSGSLQGYQAGPRRAAEIGAAVYEALRELGINYVGSPASFEDTGQKIRTTAAVLRERLGNCVDLSVTYAACLEATGLHPLVWIIERHAFAGFFLSEDRLPETVSLDPAQMINVVESGTAVAVELTGVGPGADSVAFAEATRLGRAHLRGSAALFGMVDIRLAHRTGIQPLPSTDPRPAWPVEEPAVPATGASLALPAELEASGALDQEENLEVEAADDGAPARIAAWRRALLDLSLRNPLLKLPKRGKGLDLHVPAGSLAVLDDLVHSGKAIDVVAQDNISGVHELQGVRRVQDLPDEVTEQELAKDRRIYGAVTQSSYVARMRGLQRDARTLQQETGSNYLYLTLGSLVHPTPSGDAHAPLFLLPVRIEGGAGNRPYTVLIDGAEVAAPNHCLVQWLRVKHGVWIAELEQPILDDDGIDIDASFRAIKKALVDNHLNYRVDETASLRLLQFSTFQMWRDLTEHWQVFTRNAVVRHLVERSGQPMSADEPATTVDESALFLPIAADGSQMRAVELAAGGRSFVLEGPPGTGKSQTITNLIAHATASGKSVLFVAEKQAALDVVKRRLAAVGLEPFCLDLHGRKQTARSIHAQLKAAHEALADDDQHAWQSIEAAYRARVAALREYPERLHAENSAGFSAWSAYSALLAQEPGDRAVILATFFALSQQQRADVTEAARALPAIASAARPRHDHPWRISGRRTVADLPAQVLTGMATGLERLRTEFGQYSEQLRRSIAELPHPSHVLEAVPAAKLAVQGRLPDASATTAAEQRGWDAIAEAAIQQVRALHTEHRAILSVLRPEFFTDPAFDVITAQAAVANKGLFGRKKRRTALAEALQPFVTSSVDQAAVIDTVTAAAAAQDAARRAADAVHSVPGCTVPSDWWPTRPGATGVVADARDALVISRELHRTRPALWTAVHRLGRHVPDLDAFARLWTGWLGVLATSDADFARWSADLGWVEAWHADGPRWHADITAGGARPVQRWGAVLTQTDVLAAAGLNEFRRQVLDGSLDAADIEQAFHRGVAAAALDERLHANDLEYFDAGAHQDDVADYLRLGARVREQLPERLAAGLVAHRQRIHPRFRAEAGELVRRLNSRRDRLSFREACADQFEIVTGLTPCFLMSPASAATFLEPGSAHFDIVVFDEASQIRVAQAVGVMGRASSVVVVGDSKQMPPTSVMEAAHADEEDNPAVPEDLDSILAECVESGLPRESLTWHYRSTDESLISFSNTHYYDDKLASLPSPGGDPAAGISWRRVDGHYDRGTRASRTNRVEAEAIVAEISRLLADPRTADRSVGVITFNVQQRDLLLNLVEESIDPRVQAALARDDGEALFVKNLENVQGDERDVILFSLAFSIDPKTGQLPLNFGPLSNQGGERRLNVAITRARTQVILFSSFAPKDIDLTRTTALGTRHLRAYLEQAANGVASSGDVISRKDVRRDRVAEELATALRERGHEVAVHFGLSHFTVDLAVRRAGSARWSTAVLLDGQAWAQRPTVADRDAAPQLLERLMGWPAVCRVWLPQWLNDRDTVLANIEELLAEPAPAADDSPPGEATGRIAVRPEFSSSPARQSTAVVPLRVPAPALQRAVTPQRPTVGVDSPRDFVPYRPTQIGTPEDIDALTRDHRVQQLVRESLEEAIESEGPIEVDRLGHNGRAYARRCGLCRPWLHQHSRSARDAADTLHRWLQLMVTHVHPAPAHGETSAPRSTLPADDAAE